MPKEGTNLYGKLPVAVNATGYVGITGVQQNVLNSQKPKLSDSYGAMPMSTVSGKEVLIESTSKTGQVATPEHSYGKMPEIKKINEYSKMPGNVQ